MKRFSKASERRRLRKSKASRWRMPEMRHSPHRIEIPQNGIMEVSVKRFPKAELWRLMQKMEAVVFDMDGVLFDTERLCMESWREVAAEKGIKDIEPAVLGCIGLNRNDTIQFFKDHYGADFDFEDFRMGYSQRMEQKLKEGGLPVKPGVRELLRYLKEKKIPIAVASSTRTERVLCLLREAGIRDYFQVVIGGDKVLHSKPEPDIYLMACDNLRVSPEKSFAIEDSLNGIRSAFRAGMRVVMVPDMIAPTPEAKEKTAVIKDTLTEVMNWFQESKAFA